MVVNVRGYDIEVIGTVSSTVLGGAKAFHGVIVNNGRYDYKRRSKIEGDQVIVTPDGKILSYESSEARKYDTPDEELDINIICLTITNLYDGRFQAMRTSMLETLKYIESFRKKKE